ncbi:hypothetical protein SFUMM280S_05768 [Streptomyces fumanus]
MLMRSILTPSGKLGQVYVVHLAIGTAGCRRPSPYRCIMLFPVSILVTQRLPEVSRVTWPALA